ncbi:MAG: hypothetical protein V4620_13290 [Bacteroidota bacterium]
MTDLNEEQIIDILLSKLDEVYPNTINVSNEIRTLVLNENKPDNDEFRRVFGIVDETLLKNKLARQGGGFSADMIITPLGREIVKNGGYLAYLDRQANEAKIAADRQIVADEHARWALRQTKRQVKWFFPLTIVAFIGGVLSIYTTGKSIVQQSHIDSLEIQVQSIQTTIDSLTNPSFQHTKSDTLK